MKRLLWILLLFLPAVLGAGTMYAVTRMGENGRIIQEHPLYISYDIRWSQAQWEQLPFLQAMTGPDPASKSVDATRFADWLETQNIDPKLSLGIGGRSREYYGAMATEIYLHLSLVDHHAFFQHLKSVLPRESFYIASFDSLRCYGFRPHSRSKGIRAYEVIANDLEPAEFDPPRTTFIRLDLGQPQVRIFSLKPHFSMTTKTLRFAAPLWLVTLGLLSLPAPFIFLLRRPLARILRSTIHLPSSTG